MKRKQQKGIFGDIRKNKNRYIEKFLDYYNNSLNDSDND